MSVALDLAAGLDPVVFSSDVLGMTPDEWQAGVLRSQSPRLLMNCARQSGKSTVAAVLALHTALYKPKSLTLMVSPSQRQSTELYRKVQDLVDEMPAAPGFREDTKTSATLDNGSRVVSLPSSEATIRGYSGVDLLIEDEAARVPDDLFVATRPMLATSNGRHVLMSTPWGMRGHFFDAWQQGAPWEIVKVDAYDCPRISREFLEEERRVLGDLWFRSEYLCEFTDTVDNVFRFDDVARAITDDVTPLFGMVAS